MSMPTKSQKTCFVIMPYGEKTDTGNNSINFDDVYKYIIKLPFQKLKNEGIDIEVIRCDEITSTGSIHRDMIHHILHDELAIVDITMLNPNVFYELGVRHALRRSGTILIRKAGTQNPFNIQGMRTYEYDTDMPGVYAAQEKLADLIKSALSNSESDSLVYDMFPGLKVTLTDG